jgi:hypothetical protein
MRKAIRVATATFGVLLLAAFGVAAASAEEQYGDENVVVTVEIDEVEEGTLALTVASNTTSLGESGSTDLVRQFTGTLPTVTVTDTRDAEDIDDSAFWYVLGQATDFSDGDTETIPVENFGWEPALTGPNDGEGSVAAGPLVGTALDALPDDGLDIGELLYMAGDSEEYLDEGSWQATAALVLKAPASVVPGTYTSTITLSLFE